MFSLASMHLWASAMFSRLNVLSITGLREAVCSEKCGNTRCEKAFIRSALYCEGKTQSKNQVQLHIRTYKWAVSKLTQKHTEQSSTAGLSFGRSTAGVSFLFEFLPEGCESGGGCWASGLAWRAVCPADLPLLPFLPWCRTASTCHRWPESSHFAPSYAHQCSQGWRLLPCLWNYSCLLPSWIVQIFNLQLLIWLQPLRRVLVLYLFILIVISNTQVLYVIWMDHLKCNQDFYMRLHAFTICKRALSTDKQIPCKGQDQQWTGKPDKFHLNGLSCTFVACCVPPFLFIFKKKSLIYLIPLCSTVAQKLFKVSHIFAQDSMFYNEHIVVYFVSVPHTLICRSIY